MEHGDARDMLRLIETVKYLGGIAERVEGRQQREDETTEKFVLEYVKQLEAQTSEPTPHKVGILEEELLDLLLIIFHSYERRVADILNEHSPVVQTQHKE